MSTASVSLIITGSVQINLFAPLSYFLIMPFSELTEIVFALTSVTMKLRDTFNTLLDHGRHFETLSHKY